MVHRLKLFVALFFLILTTYGQTVYDTIIFEGMHPKTAQNCLLISGLKEKKLIDSSAIQIAKQNLLNTRIFSSIEVKLDSNRLIFQPEKVLSLLPILNLGHVRGNPFYQLGFRDLNFLHRFGVFKLYTIYLNHRYSFYNYMEIPYYRKTKWGLLSDISISHTREPIFFQNKTELFNLDTKNFTFGSFYQLDPFHRIGLAFGWNQQAFHMLSQNSESIVRIEKGFQIKLFHLKQRINYQSIYLDGWSLQSELKSTFGSIIPFFNQGIATASFYKRIRQKQNLATRLKIGFTSNQIGYFGPFTLDSYLNLRGAGTQVDRGTGQIVLNLEHRIAFWESKKMCLQGVFFSDFGTWRKPYQSIEDMFQKSSVKSFSGAGIRLSFTKVYDLIFRADYGFSIQEDKKRGFVFGIGQYF